MRIYISGAMTGCADFRERFREAERYLRERYRDAEIINPAIPLGALPDSMEWNQYMDVSLSILRGCDTVYMLNGWGRSKGARIERLYAMGSGMTLIYEE